MTDIETRRGQTHTQSLLATSFIQSHFDLPSGSEALDGYSSPQDYLDVTMTYLQRLSPATLDLYGRHTDEVKTVLAEPGWHVFPITRLDIHAEQLKKLNYFWSARQGREKYQEAFGPEGRYGYETAAAVLWETLGYQIFLDSKRESENIILGTSVSVSRQYLVTFLKKFFTIRDYSESQKRTKLCLEAIEAGYWPIFKAGGRFFFNNPLVFFHLASAGFLEREREDRMTNSIVWEHGLLDPKQKLKIAKESLIETEILSSSSDQEKYFYFFSFIAEFFCKRSSRVAEFKEFILWLKENGSATFAVRIFQDVYFNNILPSGYNSPFFVRELFLTIKELEIGLKSFSKEKATLEGIKRDLWQERPDYLYSIRPTVVSQETIDQAQGKPSRLWEIVFKNQVEPEMRKLFGNDPQLTEIYATALRERKVVSGLLVVFGHIFGLGPEQVNQLAAIAQFTWGWIIEEDNIADGHEFRKNAPTLVASEGLSDASEKVIIAVAKSLEAALPAEQSQKIIKEYCSMIQGMYQADIALRKMDWQTSEKEVLKSMNELNSAFSWFIDLMSQTRSAGMAKEFQERFTRAGELFSRFMDGVNTAAQLINDLEDWNPAPGKKEPGADIGQRISLNWQALINLPNEVLSQKEKQKIKRLFQQKTLKSIQELLAIANRHRQLVTKSLSPLVEEVTQKTEADLKAGFEVLSGIDYLGEPDSVNQAYQEILTVYLHNLRRRFYSLLPQGS